jgi:hypothetical protein
MSYYFAAVVVIVLFVICVAAYLVADIIKGKISEHLARRRLAGDKKKLEKEARKQEVK